MPGMHRLSALALAWLMTAFSTPRPAAAPDSPAPGVPHTLAAERRQRITNLGYELHFFVPETQSLAVTGRATIRFELAGPPSALALDFAGPAGSVRGLTVNGRTTDADVRAEHLLLAASTLQEGANVAEVRFESSDLALNRSPEFMYTLFVPARARLAFPCFDQPDLKARYRLTLDVPAGWEAVANGPELSRQKTSDSMRLTFAETRPIPTYLFAFAAGRFSVETAGRNGRRFRMLHRETDSDKVARNRDAIFDLHAFALEWLERYTGIPYPFEKFDFLLVPSFQFGGMEHPGAIFYNAPSLLLDPSATQNQKLGRASLIAHETAHMWFGDLVTMKWFDDVWMKEVFANFVAAKIVNPTFPEINHELRFLFAHYPAAYDVDRTPGTNAIRQRLDNLNDAGSLYGAIIYQKAPIVMRQLEMIVTEDGLRDGLRDYLKAHAYDNASWPDLIQVLDGRTPEDLATWSRTWVEEAGRPVVTIRRVQDWGSTLLLDLSQKDSVASRGLAWSQHLKLTFGYPDGLRTYDARLGRLGRPATTFSITHGGELGRPLYVLPTGGGIGYGEFVLDDATRAYLTAHLADIPDALTRGAALVTLWEEMLAGRVTPPAMFETIVGSLPRETDELTVQRMLSYAQQAFWKFLDPRDRDRRAPALERLLRAGLDEAKTSSLKSAWFNALRDVVRTPETLAWLERVWRQTEPVPDLTLSEPDYITLALELAAREVPSWDQILDGQQARIRNPDRLAQFEFVRPALSADAATRDAFFASLREVKNRRREAWVLQGIRYLHHPLRAATAEKHIPASLALLREIQETGDIFFPKRWADATLAGHRTASAARMVHGFLNGLPGDYPERLRRIVLSAADDLFRASRLR
jgi:aminopeptidase N